MESLSDRITPSAVTSLASTTAAGAQMLGNSNAPALSANGLLVAFLSDAKLTADDTNAFTDVYLKDRSTGSVALVSRADGLAGAAGNSSAFSAPSVSDDGRFVAFSSNATNLVSQLDANAGPDVFVRDVVAGTTKLVSVSVAGGTTGNGQSRFAHISGDGKTVSFASSASNLIAGDTNAASDIFVRDLNTGTTTSVSTDSVGAQGAPGKQSIANNISADGRFVVFSSNAALSADDSNGFFDVFVKDRVTGVTTRVSVSSAGVQGNSDSGGTLFFAPSLGISDDGKTVAFESVASNLVATDINAVSDIFVRDLGTNTTTRVSTNSAGGESNGGGFSQNADISGNGRYVVFESFASNLVTGDGNGFVDIFVKDRVTGATTRENVSTAGVQANGTSQSAAISRDGQFVAFESGAQNLVTPDANGSFDVFVHQRPLTSEIVAAPGAGGASTVKVINPDGSPKATFQAYPPGYTGGVFVAQGDMNNDGVAEVVTSTGVGGAANIRVYTQAGVLKASVFAYPEAFTGGVNVAVADVNGDGIADIICGVGKNGGPNIRIIDGKQLMAGVTNLVSADGSLGKSDCLLMFSKFAFDPGFTGGVRVAAADLNGDGFADIIVAAASGGGPHVRVFDGKSASQDKLVELRSGFFAYDSTFTGGVFLSTGDVDNDGQTDILTGVESGGGPNVRAFNWKTAAGNDPIRNFFGFDPTQTGGVRVASSDVNKDGFDDFVLGTGPGTGSRVKAVSGKDGVTQLLAPLDVFGGFLGGVNVG